MSLITRLHELARFAGKSTVLDADANKAEEFEGCVVTKLTILFIVT